MRNILLAGLSLVPAAVLFAQEANYDESKVPSYTPPRSAGRREVGGGLAQTAAEIFALFEREMFGKAPAFDPAGLKADAGGPAIALLDGKAVLEQPVLRVAGQNLLLMIIRPAKADKPCPAFLSYNFKGNHCVHPDPAISVSPSWMRETKEKKSAEELRGSDAGRWALNQIIDRGYALVTLYYGDVDPDFHDGFTNGVHAAYGIPKGDEWGSIAAWAWGLSRVLDYLGTKPEIDAKRVAVMGHSRLGKTSLWAGAADERFALVISNNSGCGARALSRRHFGETVQRINTSFPHWFCGNFKKYNVNEAALPIDQHELIALSAPRPVYVASAEEDRWADPRGEFLSAFGADPVYRLLGMEGLPAKEMPAVNQPVQGRIGYHIRSGKHDVTDYDWEQYLKFADKHLR